MYASESLIATNTEPSILSGARIEPVLGLAVGLGGGIVRSFALHTPVTHGLVVGGQKQVHHRQAGVVWYLVSSSLGAPPARGQA